MQEKSPVFIVGAQRSGTTLLRLMLNAHSQIAIPEEGTFWMPLLRRYKNNKFQKFNSIKRERYKKYLLSNCQFKLWGMDSAECVSIFTDSEMINLPTLMESFYKLYARKQGKDIWGDKTPSFFRMTPVLAQLFPQAKFINVIRDGRDLFLSWKKMNPAKSNIAVVAYEWRYKLLKSNEDLKRFVPGRFIEVKYEDLASCPEEELRKISQFLKIPFESGMLSYWKTSPQYIGKHHSELIFKPPSTKSINKWKNQLTSKEINIFESIAHDCLTNYGYELFIQKQNLKKIEAYSKFCYGLPYRIMEVFSAALKLSVASRLGLQTDAAGCGKAPRKN